MADSVSIGAEQEIPGGWRFEVRVESAPAPARSMAVRLSWQDYEHWSQGVAPPATIVQRLLNAAVDLGIADRLRNEFDAGLIRRLAPGIDEQMRAGGGVG